VRAALAEPSAGIVHLACHGRFDERNPWTSTIRTSDGDLRLHDLLVGGGRPGPAIVLAACEGGRSLRAPSDEPLGFAALLLRAGAAAVVAPSWRVDDFSSLLLLTEFHDRRARAPVAAALAAAGRWLHDLPAADALERLGTFEALLEEHGEEWESVRRWLARNRAWLEGSAVPSAPSAPCSTGPRSR
jgi:CHAT domain-containing protein